MSRHCKWRQQCPDIVRERLREAGEARLYLLRQTGPTGFLVREDESPQKRKVYLGNPHTCTCAGFCKEKELCIHILWILLKKFRVSVDEQVIFQLCLVEREINGVVRGIYSKVDPPTTTPSVKPISSNDKGVLPQKLPGKDDVCSICQDPLRIKQEALTYCKHGCGNTIHTRCMKIYADHQSSNGDAIVKCPLCRSEFGSYHVLNQEFLKQLNHQKAKNSTVHNGTHCRQCHVTPITGKCFRCLQCADFLLCEKCVASVRHPHSGFEYKLRSNQRWRSVDPVMEDIAPMAVVGGILPRMDIAPKTCLVPAAHRKGTASQSQTLTGYSWNEFRGRLRRDSNSTSHQAPNWHELSVVGLQQTLPVSLLPARESPPLVVRSAPVRRPAVLPPLPGDIKRCKSLRKLRRPLVVKDAMSSLQQFHGLMHINGAPSILDVSPPVRQQPSGTVTLASLKPGRRPSDPPLEPQARNAAAANLSEMVRVSQLNAQPQSQ